MRASILPNDVCSTLVWIVLEGAAQRESLMEVRIPISGGPEKHNQMV
jgi:hypothetical protein